LSNNSTQHIARHYKSRKASDIVNFPVPFRRTALSGADNDLAKLPVSSFRILFKVLNDVSYDQFHPTKQMNQLKLFEEDMLTAHNTFASFSFPTKDVDPHLDYKAIMGGLEALENLNKGWHKSKNSEGKTVKAFGGVISNPAISEGKVSFLMSSYWISQIMSIPHYNRALFRTPWEMKKGKHILFYLWLLELPDTGTKVNYEKFQEFYDYNYKDAQSLGKYALKPLRELLNRVSNRSFNYKTSGNNINFMPYYTKDVELELEDDTVSAQKITQKIHYWKVRHKLEKNHTDMLRSLFNLDGGTFQLLLKSYDEFIKWCKEESTRATVYTGDNFISIFQNKIIDYYNSTEMGNIDPTGYPVIVEQDDNQ